MKKLFLVFFCLSSLTFFSGNIASAQNISDIFTEESINAFTEKTGLSDYTQYEFNTKGEELEYGGKGGTQFRSVAKYAIDYLRKILVSIAVLFFLWGGAELIIGRGKEEDFKAKKNMLISTAVGFIILILATTIIDTIFFGPTGDFLEAIPDAKGPTAIVGSNVVGYAKESTLQLKGLFQYFTSWVVLAGVAFLIFSAFKMILSAGENEEQISKLKKRIVFTILGMVLIVSSEKLIELFSDSSKEKFAIPKVDKLIELVVDWINFALGFVGILAIVALIWGGIRLIVSFGENEQSVQEAKRTIFSSIIGLIVAFSCWTLVYFFLVV